MKVNKITVYISVILIVLSGIIAYVLYDNEIDNLANVISSIFTGFIITFVTSLTLYFFEKTKLLVKSKYVLESLYMNISLLKEITGTTLVQSSQNNVGLQQNCNKIINISNTNKETLKDLDIELYSPFFKNQTYWLIEEIIDYKGELYNLMTICTNLNSRVNEYMNFFNILINKTASGIDITQEEYKKDKEITNYIIIKLAKIHEYQASLLNTVTKLLNKLNSNKRNQKIWSERKLYLDNRVKEIVKNDESIM